MIFLRSRLPELASLERVLEGLPSASHRVLANVAHGQQSLPVHAITLGPDDRTLPTIAFIGGVHGLERIGTQVLLSYLEMLQSALRWDSVLAEMLKRLRIVMVPLLNPVGMALGLRSNGNGVDLMRNAPVQAEHDSRWFELHRGQRLTPFLPWYQGRQGEPMQDEAAALCDFIEQHLFESRCGIVVDVHSGFLPGDRIWFPYARSRKPFAHTPEVMALTRLLGDTHANPVYTVEPQSIIYTKHGDLWDYVYDRHQAARSAGVFLPLTLEISSQKWYRKNPRQLIRRMGLFHPFKLHRLERVQRRHKTLFDFLTRATVSHPFWVPGTEAQRATLLQEAIERWDFDSSQSSI
jgi:hypothetical protein